MAGILDLNSNSSDSEDDCDYVPPEGELSDLSEEDLETETVNDKSVCTGKNRKGRRKNKSFTADEVEVEKSVSETKLSAEEQKKRTENIWKSFLDDVGTTSVKKKISTGLTSGENIPIVSSTEIKKGLINSPKKMTVTEVFEFAGESVTVTKEIDSKEQQTKAICSEPSEANKSNTEVKTAQNIFVRKRQGGLDSLIGNIMNKKQKMTTLQKSLHDWNTFKKDEGLDKDLEKFNKGKGGFLEKQAFLQRSDLRQFELEKNVRLSNKTK